MYPRDLDIKNPKNLGYEFEHKIYEKFIKLGFRKIIHETELRKKYGWNANSVDFLIESENGIIIIQTKWMKTMRRSTKYVNNFIKSIKFINEIYGKPYLYGLWISRMKPFNDNISKLENEGVFCVSDFTSMDDLITKSCNLLLSKNV
jgi:hypothetical protein